MALSAKSKLVRTLRRLQRERDPAKRAHLIELGRKALLNWFAMGARNLIKGVLPINKQTQKFINNHRQDLRIIADQSASDEDRKTAILKRGGAGFLGGVIIRHLFKWNSPKKRRVRRLKSVVVRVDNKKQRVFPDWMVRVGGAAQKSRKKKKRKAPPKKKTAPSKKTPAGKRRKSAPQTLAQRKAMPENLKNEINQYYKEQRQKTIGELLKKQAELRMDRAMGPIGSQRASDLEVFPRVNVGIPSSSPGIKVPIHVPKITRFQPLTASTPQLPKGLRYKCRYCGKIYVREKARDKHESDKHGGYAPP